MKRSIALILGLALLATGCAGLGGGDPVAAIKSKGKLTCGVKFDVVGFGFNNTQTGQVEGLDADLCREIAKELGVTPEFVEAVSANRLPFLKEDKVDLVISTMTVNEERKKEIDFSHVYYIAGQQILVKSESDIDAVEDLVGKKVCSGEGSTSEKNLRDKGVAQTDLLLFKTYTEAAQALVDGRCEAVSTDNTILFGLAQQFEGTEVVGATFTQEPLGIGIKKGKEPLVAFVNQTLEKMKADGRLKALYDTHIKPFTGEDVQAPF
jgi:putative glutamine transport system substrate-binding protein